MIMNLWTMIVLIVAIYVISNNIKSRNNNGLNKSVTPDENISMVLASLKRRVENLETIVLEQERNRRFTELEKN